MRKPRPDSKIGTLPPDIREEVDEMLITNRATLQEVADHIQARAGVRVARSSVAAYLHTHLALARRAYLSALAARLAKLNTDGISRASAALVRQETLAMLAEAQGDPETLQQAARLSAESERLRLEAERLQLEERKLALREAEAAKAEEAARRAADESLTPEERRAKIAALFGL